MSFHWSAEQTSARCTIREAVLVIGLAAAASLMAMAGGPAAIASDDRVVVPKGTAEWGPGPQSLPEGAEAAVLYGDPSKAEVFAMRLKLPDGYRIAPHSHPKPEIVTILSGTLHLGSGEDVTGQTQALEPGSFFGIAPGSVHYVSAEGETVIQLNSVGPWAIEYVSDADDPRS